MIEYDQETPEVIAVSTRLLIVGRKIRCIRKGNDMKRAICVFGVLLIVLFNGCISAVKG